MSGRLIILPKKSYCPWNPSNVERVLRDEREHAESQEREASQQKQESSRARLQLLHNKGRVSDGEAAAVESSSGSGSDKRRSPQVEVAAQHVNLFAVEEEAHRKRVEDATAIDSRKGKQKNNGIMPLYLGQSAQTDSFYLKGGDHFLSKDDQDKASNPKEDRLKSRMDPMKEFVRAETAPRRVAAPSEEPSIKPATKKSSHNKRKHKHRRGSSKQRLDSSSSDSDSSSSSRTSSDDDDDSYERRRRRRKRRKSSSSRKRGSREKKSKIDKASPQNAVEELRRKRAEREAKERLRQERVIASAEGHVHSKYQDQYHPGLSRY